MADNIAMEPALEQMRDFRFGAVPETQQPAAPEGEARVAQAVAPPDLGALARFVGVFQGTGLNTIFRPQSAVTPTKLPKPPHGPSDNVLELNLTTETLSFSDALGTVPNRGSGAVQGDVFLNGVPYVQSINDVTDRRKKPEGIHFEPGVWLAVPRTAVPEATPSIARMASIPHGTTINAQGNSFSVQGGPRIDPVDITPFPIGGDQKKNGIKFPSQTAADDATFRLPQDLTSHIKAGTITQAILDDPNTVIRARAARQNITHTDVITISTQPSAPLFGGGNANIAFLLGDPKATNPNADAVSTTAIFWVELVRETITVPPLTPGRAVTVAGNPAVGDPVPRFSVSSPTGTTKPTQVEVAYTQIQYTQTVLLNFATLSWPHVSVATLVPNRPIPITVP